MIEYLGDPLDRMYNKERDRKQKKIFLWVLSNIFLFCFICFIEKNKIFQFILLYNKTFFFGIKNKHIAKLVFLLLRLFILLNGFFFIISLFSYKAERLSEERKNFCLKNQEKKVSFLDIKPNFETIKEDKETQEIKNEKDFRPKYFGDKESAFSLWTKNMKTWNEKKSCFDSSSFLFRIEKIKAEEALLLFGGEKQIEKMIEIISKNIFQKVILPVAKEIETIEKEFLFIKRKGLFGFETTSLFQKEINKQLTVSSAVQSKEAYPFYKGNFSSTNIEQRKSLLEKYLARTDSIKGTEYSWNRIKDLAKSGCVSRHGSFPISDSEIVFRLVVGYLDTRLSSADLFEENPFSSSFVSVCKKEDVCNEEQYKIRMIKDKNISFDFCIGKKIYETRQGRNSLFEALVFFFRYCESNKEGFVGSSKICELELL